MSQIIANFSRLKGIGPAIEARLHSAGVVTWGGLSGILTALGGIRGISNEMLRILAREAADLAEAGDDGPEPSPGGEARMEAFVVKVVLDSEGDGVRTQVADARTQEEDRWTGWRPQDAIDFIERQSGIARAATPGHPKHPEPARAARHHVLDAGKVVGGGSRHVDLTVATESLAHRDVGEIEYQAVLTGRQYGQPTGMRRSVATLSGRARSPGDLELGFDTIELPEGLIQLELEIDVRLPEESALDRPA